MRTERDKKMAYSQPSYRQKISFGQSNNALTMLIFANLVVFVILLFMKVIYNFLYREDGQGDAFFMERVMAWFALPADTSKLATRPWTIISSMFSEIGILQIIGNMLWLWAFGYILQDLTGNRKIIPVFFYGGLLGSIAFLVASSLIPGASGGIFWGASAGVMAIAVVTTMVAPGFRIFPMLNGGIPIWILTALYILIDAVSIPTGNPAIPIAHLGGALAGVLFMLLLRAGYDGSDWMNNFYDWLNNLFNPDKPRHNKGFRETLFYKNDGEPFKRTPNVTQRRVDAILDKINQEGYHSLSEEEKELLKRAGEEEL